MTRKFITGIIVLHLWGQYSYSQNFIGKTKDAVRQLMKEHKKEFYEDKFSRNPEYNLVKYVDRQDNQTLLYVFDENDICMYSKLICDYSMLRGTINSLNKSYEQKNDSIWYYLEGEETYMVNFKKEEWYFTVMIKKEE